MITAKDAIDLITLAESQGIEVFLDGGWGVDALLGEQTREHQDIDLFVRKEQAVLYILLLQNNRIKRRIKRI